MNRKNLEKLANYLLHGKLDARFDMIDYAEPEYANNGTTCGSVGCLIGHAPFCGIKKYPEEEWDNYSERVFGITNYSPTWEWLFDYTWAQIDNTSHGAACRILWLLYEGLPPDSYGQRCGHMPLCYR